MKLIDKYYELKSKDENKIYIFECGVFYIFFNEDAEVISEKLKIKLVGLNDRDCKCGFPIKTKDKYFKIIDEQKILYEIITNEKRPVKVNSKNDIEKEIIRKLKSINVEYLNYQEAYKFLIELKEIIK